MTPAEVLLRRLNSPHGWVALSKEECLAVHGQIDDLIDTLDAVTIILMKLGIYLPEDTYPSELVSEARSLINKHWELFIPNAF